jgi:hypothetical protein
MSDAGSFGTASTKPESSFRTLPTRGETARIVHVCADSLGTSIASAAPGSIAFRREPCAREIIVEDDRHARMRLPHKVVRGGRYDRATGEFVTIRVPYVPEAGERKWFAVDAMDPQRRLRSISVLSPFVEAVGEDDASAFARRLPIGRSGRDRLNARVERR